MTASFTIYIDESGDEGFAFHPNERGSSRWLVLSATVFRKQNDLDAVRLMREVREMLGKEPKKALHFRELKHEQRAYEADQDSAKAYLKKAHARFIPDTAQMRDGAVSDSE